MGLSTENREALRVALLMVLNEAAKDKGMPLRGFLGVGTALKMANASYKGLEPEVIDAEVLYLVGKGFAEEVKKAMSPENKRYRITVDGRDFLAEEGLG